MFKENESESTKKGYEAMCSSKNTFKNNNVSYTS